MRKTKLSGVMVLILVVAALLIFNTSIPLSSVTTNNTSSSNSNNNNGGASGGVTPINTVTDSCQATAEANGYSFYHSPHSTPMSCLTYASTNCLNKGQVTNGVAYSDALDCCVWNCKTQTPPTSKYLCCQAMGVLSCYENACPPAGIKIAEYTALNTCQTNCVKQWNPGDIVIGGSGSGSITGGSVPVGASIDLSDYGITEGGSCQLGVRIGTSWDYALGSKCTGLQGSEGLKWEFFDSHGLEYSRIDSAPIGFNVDLHPTAHYLEWHDGSLWSATVSKTLNLPECNIDYEYDVEIYIYSCS